jgi:N-acyl-D-aspartate/D-glutamate deacylase
MSAELVIRGGTVFDGSGAPGRAADVAIAGGVIREIGPKLRGRRELDASGCAVAPGFIDIHTHYDAQVFWDPALRPSCFHGVTTVVAGNCGFTIAPTRPEHHDVIVRTLETRPVRRVRDFRAHAERLPAEEPTGVRHVLVNGTPIRSDGRSLIDSLEPRPGMRPEIA